MSLPHFAPTHLASPCVASIDWAVDLIYRATAQVGRTNTGESPLLRFFVLCVQLHQADADSHSHGWVPVV